ncbi:MAG TPA: zinc ribbon domain-containing protein [Terriglobales bacterium]|jgi:putative FmdB family regulatory protein|nr:zinc ribbon domain-containing protein [Terriglobales bacterium]
MPNYEYLCKDCGHRFEQIRKFSDKPLRKCPECGGVIEQVISAPAVQFKGSGWYVTDYAKKSAASTESSSSSEGEGRAKDKGAKDSKETKDTKKEDKPKTDSSSKKQKKE